MKKLIATLVILSALIFSATPLRADEEIRKLQIDLKVKGFTQNEWYDNLDSKNIIFAPADKFQLKIKVGNYGNRNQTQIKVHQILPSTVTIDFDGDFTISQLIPNQEWVKEITVTVKNKAYIYQALTQSYLTYNLKSDVGSQDSDSAYFYTSNGNKGVGSTAATPVIPVTGAGSTLIFGSAIAVASILAGIGLRKFARGY